MTDIFPMALVCLLLLSIFLTAQAGESWVLPGLGNVRFTHFYYEGETLQGVCVGTEEGVIGLIDHKTGNIKWRDLPLAGRRLMRFLPEGRCKSHAIILLDLLTIVDNYTKAEVFDLSSGKIVNTVVLDKNVHKLSFTDGIIVNASSTNLTYAIMTNRLLQVYENNKEKWALKAR